MTSFLIYGKLPSNLYNMVYEILIEGDQKQYNEDNPLINLGLMYGIFRNEKNMVKMHNRIYEQRVYNYMSSKIETSTTTGHYNFRDNFIDEHDNLGLEQALIKGSSVNVLTYPAKRRQTLCTIH